MPSTDPDRVSANDLKDRARVLADLCKHPGSKTREIGRRLNASPDAIFLIVRALIDLDRVREERPLGQAANYSPTEIGMAVNEGSYSPPSQKDVSKKPAAKASVSEVSDLGKEILSIWSRQLTAKISDVKGGVATLLAQHLPGRAEKAIDRELRSLAGRGLVLLRDDRYYIYDAALTDTGLALAKGKKPVTVAPSGAIDSGATSQRPHLNRERDTEILKSLVTQPMQTAAEIAEVIGLSEMPVRAKLGRLVEEGFLSKRIRPTQSGKGKAPYGYEITPEGLTQLGLDDLTAVADDATEPRQPDNTAPVEPEVLPGRIKALVAERPFVRPASDFYDDMAKAVEATPDETERAVTKMARASEVELTASGIYNRLRLRH